MNYDIKNNTLEECLNHWRNPKDHNSSENYNKSHTQQRSIYLTNIFKKYIHNKSKILEIGCNCCRNLSYLYNANYHNLYGIEINENALSLSRKFFNNLDNVVLINSAIEDFILNFKDNEFDVVFTMAVLQHIHVDSNWIFEHIARISKQYIILIELETRDYKKIFEKFNFKQIERRSCHLIKGLKKYKTIILKRI